MNRDCNTTRRRAGFTVMELLIVVAIVGIIVLMSMMAYLRLRPRFVLMGVAQEVVSQIHQARMAAIQQSRNVRILVETQTGGTATYYNPTGVTFEWLTVRIVESAGVEREISSYQIPKNYPPVYLWGHGESEVVGGPQSNTFDDDDMLLTPGGTLADTGDAGGAFRFSSPNGEGNKRNTLEVTIPTASAGSPRIHKYLYMEDLPSGASGSGYVPETVAQISTTKNLWVWY